MSAETELIKDRLDIAEIVGEYVQLKRAGRYFKGLCPFHNEKTPSFVVSPDKGIWHCFGACGEGGDIFSFVEKIENVEFPAALKLLAERAGVEIKKSPVLQQVQGKRQRLFDLLELTGRFYHEILMNHAAGKKAKEYLRQRGVKEETGELFQIGYAPLKWDALQNFLRAKGYAPREMLAAGVAGENERGKLYDRFRGRIMFPIYELQGRVVAFGGRIAPWHKTGEEGKYINSPETELYAKRRVVYNLHNAKHYLKHQTPCLVVEGYMDVIMVAQAGARHVVASSGTAFTEEQVRQIKRFTNELHFAFDADAAGLKAAISATREALKGGLRVATVVLPEGSDPADIAGGSTQNLKRHLAKTQSLVSVLLGRVKEAREGQKKEEYLQELLPLIAEASNAVYQGELVQEAASALHVPESRIVSQLQQMSRSRLDSNRPADEKEEQREEPTISREQYLLGLMVASPAARKELFADIKKSFIADDAAKMLYNALRGLFKTESSFTDWSGEELLEHLPEELVSYAEGVRVRTADRMENSHQTPVMEGRVLLENLKRRRLTRQLRILQEGLTFGGARQRAVKLKRFKTLTQQLVSMETDR